MVGIRIFFFLTWISLMIIYEICGRIAYIFLVIQWWREIICKSLVVDRVFRF